MFIADPLPLLACCSVLLLGGLVFVLWRRPFSLPELTVGSAAYLVASCVAVAAGYVSRTVASPTVVAALEYAVAACLGLLLCGVLGLAVWRLLIVRCIRQVKGRGARVAYVLVLLAPVLSFSYVRGRCVHSLSRDSGVLISVGCRPMTSTAEPSEPVPEGSSAGLNVVKLDAWAADDGPDTVPAKLPTHSGLSTADSAKPGAADDVGSSSNLMGIVPGAPEDDRRLPLPPLSRDSLHKHLRGRLGDSIRPGALLIPPRLPLRVIKSVAAAAEAAGTSEADTVTASAVPRIEVELDRPPAEAALTAVAPSSPPVRPIRRDGPGGNVTPLAKLVRHLPPLPQLSPPSPLGTPAAAAAAADTVSAQDLPTAAALRDSVVSSPGYALLGSPPLLPPSTLSPWSRPALPSLSSDRVISPVLPHSPFAAAFSPQSLRRRLADIAATRAQAALSSPPDEAASVSPPGEAAAPLPRLQRLPKVHGRRRHMVVRALDETSAYLSSAHSLELTEERPPDSPGQPGSEIRNTPDVDPLPPHSL